MKVIHNVCPWCGVDRDKLETLNAELVEALEVFIEKGLGGVSIKDFNSARRVLAKVVEQKIVIKK